MVESAAPERVARLPDGKPITPAFLTSVLPGEVVGFEVDESSIIEGRHSATFRLRLERREDTGEGVEGEKAPTSVFVKRMVCRDLLPRPLHKWRVSVASYRAEASFFKHMASNEAVRGLAPRCFWVHSDHRLGICTRRTEGTSGSDGSPESGNGKRHEPQSVADMKSVGGGEDQELEALRGSSFMLITEDVCMDGAWEQVGAMTVEKAKRALTSLACLHAAFWRDTDTENSGLWEGTGAWAENKGQVESQVSIAGTSTTGMVGSTHEHGGEGVDRRDGPEQGRHQHQHQHQHQHHSHPPIGHYAGDGGDSCLYAPGLHSHGTFWSLEKREARDLAEMEKTYAAVVEKLGPSLPGLFDSPMTINLGRRLSQNALELDALAMGRGWGQGRRGLTLLHGDPKSWNMFFRTGCGDEGHDDQALVKLIDWQWCGEGLGASDVAYLMCTSLEPSALGREADLLRHYHQELQTALSGRGVLVSGGRAEGGGCGCISLEDFLEEYDVAFLNYV
ncbi:unnamed protein product, partial [Discosporangium mesarthrocarpum]